MFPMQPLFPNQKKSNPHQKKKKLKKRNEITYAWEEPPQENCIIFAFLILGNIKV